MLKKDDYVFTLLLTGPSQLKMDIRNKRIHDDGFGYGACKRYIQKYLARTCLVVLLFNVPLPPLPNTPTIIPTY